MTGDVSGGRAVLWARTDRAARMEVEIAGRVLPASYALEDTDFTARLDVPDLAGEVEYTIRFRSLASGALSEPLTGRFRMPAPGRNVRFLWSGDTAGQGWGINPAWGGMRIYETMRQRRPDFFIHAGDTIYADGPIAAEVKLPDGTLWKNLVTEEKAKVAETLAEYHGNYRYNLLDENVRRFHAEVPQVWQWDDHETRNNWSPGSELRDDPRYREKSIAVLAARASRAFQNYAPLRFSPDERERIYRKIACGPLLDVFVVDLRSYRGPNTHNRQEAEGPETAWFGAPQFAWLARGLRESRAAWKVIASDMPLALLVTDGRDAEGRPRWEASANGDGPPLGRELELARLFADLKKHKVRNTVWLTADVHYTAAHSFHPDRAQFRDFDPFWEFVSGPLHAGTFGPGTLDNTFGPRVEFQKHPPAGQANLPPSAGMQFFGEVEIDAKTRAMRVTLRDLAGTALYEKTLEWVRGA
jgi:alkaline phosphatase D